MVEWPREMIQAELNDQLPKGLFLNSLLDWTRLDKVSLGPRNGVVDRVDRENVHLGDRHDRAEMIYV